MAFVWQSASEDDTINIGKHIAKAVRQIGCAPVCFCLWGNLGAGKSVLSRAIIRALVQDENHEVPSPTYTLVQLYDIELGEGSNEKTTISHFDLYRIEGEDDIFELGWDDAIAEGITLIEWPERLGVHNPEKRIDLRIDQIGDGREVTIKFVGYEADDELVKIIESDVS